MLLRFSDSMIIIINIVQKANISVNYIAQIVRALWLAKLADYILPHGPQNLKFRLNIF